MPPISIARNDPEISTEFHPDLAVSLKVKAVVTTFAKEVVLMVSPMKGKGEAVGSLKNTLTFLTFKAYPVFEATFPKQVPVELKDLIVSLSNNLFVEEVLLEVKVKSHFSAIGNPFVL